jgi:ELWxxDGT repeat protein
VAGEKSRGFHPGVGLGLRVSERIRRVILKNLGITPYLAGALESTNFLKKTSGILATIALVLSAVVATNLPASAADTVDVYLDTIAGASTYTAPTSIQVLGNKLIYLQNGNLYVYDKVSTTTVSLMPVGSVIQYPPFAIAGGKVIFNAWVTTNPGQELYATDGTVAGTGLLKDILPGAVESQPRNFMQFGDKVVFSIRDATNSHYELWITDGTSSGTTKIRDLNYIINYGSAVLNGKLYFQADASGYSLKVWSTDGVTANEVAAITPQEANLTTYGDWVYFNGDSTSAALSNRGNGVTGVELLRTNGTTTEIAADVNPTSNNSSWSKPTNLVVFNGALYFSADDGTHGAELMKFDGTTVSLVKDVYAGAGASSPWNMTVFNGKIYYSAVDSTNSRELYSSDGTEAGTGFLAEIFPGEVVCGPHDWFCYAQSNSSDPRLFTAFDGKLIFAAINGVVGGELFAITPPVVTPSSTPSATPSPAAVYSGPQFNAIEGRKFDANLGGLVVVTGARLHTVSKITVDGKDATITSISDSKIEFVSPAGKPGSPELNIVFANGSMTWSNALTYFDVVVEKAKLDNRTPKPIHVKKPVKVVKKPKGKN